MNNKVNNVVAGKEVLRSIEVASGQLMLNMSGMEQFREKK
jgi:hypothetical protein